MTNPATAFVGHNRAVCQTIEGILTSTLDVVIKQSLPILGIRDRLELFGGRELSGNVADLMESARCRGMDFGILGQEVH